jgi:hypothetical protein
LDLPGEPGYDLRCSADHGGDDQIGLPVEGDVDVGEVAGLVEQPRGCRTAGSVGGVGQCGDVGGLVGGGAGELGGMGPEAELHREHDEQQQRRHEDRQLAGDDPVLA